MKYLVGLLAFCCINTAVAQELSLDKPVVRFGAKVGSSFSNMNFNRAFSPPEEPVKTSWKAGLIAGLFMEVPVYEKFYIQPEYQYTETAGQDSQTGKSYKINYLSLPVLFKYQIINKLAILAGPQFDLLLAAKQKEDNKTTTITHDTEERSISLAAGLAFYPVKILGINARYIHGLNNIGIGQRSAVKEFKYDLAELSLAVRF